MTKDEETALRVWNAYRTKSLFEEDDRAINTLWREQAQARERRLLITLMSTLLQDLCLRFPFLADTFLPPPPPPSTAASSTTATSTSVPSESTFSRPTYNKNQPLDFGPYFREVTWTSQYYLRHWVVMDLEKLSSRMQPLPYYYYPAFANGDIQEKDGLFNYLFRHPKSTIGLPDYLQRAFLNRPGTGAGTGGEPGGLGSVPGGLGSVPGGLGSVPGKEGAGRILALRIPIRRLRSFQQRQDRAVRPRSKRSKEAGSRLNNTEEVEESDDDDDEEEEEEDEGEGAQAQAQTTKQLDEALMVSPSTTRSSFPTLTHEAQDKDTEGEFHYGDKEQRVVKSTASPSTSAHTADESSRPYCFTLNKLTHLRRLEICNVTENKCDWETLRRALFTLMFGSSGVRLEDFNSDDETIKRSNKIQEFSLTTQATIGPEIDGILKYFGGMQLLEIVAPSLQSHPWVSNWDPRLCGDMRVLRVGDISRLTRDQASLEDLGRFCRLDELRLKVDYPQSFQWVVDAKRRRRARTVATSVTYGSPLSSPSAPTATPVAIAEAANRTPLSLPAGDPLWSCLPHLKRLGLSNKLKHSSEVFNNAIEAFGDQLQELCIYFTAREASVRFEHPLPKLTKLAIRATHLHQFDFSTLPQQCPSLEWLVIQCSWYSPSHSEHSDAAQQERFKLYEPMNETLVDSLVQLPNLRTVFIEGHSTMKEDQILRLVRGCPSLVRIGVYMMPAVTTEVLAEIDTELFGRATKYPLKPRGVFRLPSRMSNFMDHDFHWRITQFGYDDD
ncbi:hypothetical protein BGX29_003490 [Mortierella sp. GBA35]|nr:hypothetical protein BGX29_003490 [Mortierella sp. GBA35]